MQKFLLVGALCAVTFGSVCPHVRAQTAPLANAQTAPASGYDLLLEARALIKAGPNGSPSVAEQLAPAENLRRQRLAAARNAPALAKLRAALALGITVPFPKDSEDVGGFSVFASSRELARQLYQQAAVRAADGDALGAAQSSLDSLKLGAQISHGPLINSLVGIAVCAIARKSLGQHAAQLDAAQSRAVAEQIETISAQIQTQTQMLRAEEKFGMQSIAQTFAQWNDPKKRAKLQTELNVDDEYNRATRAMLKLSVADVQADYRAQFDKAIARAAQSYFAEAQAAPIRGDIASVNLTLDVIVNSSTRFNFERDDLNNRLLAATLRLHAIKLETGQYPATFDAGVDPFSPDLAPLIYKRAGNSYVLYSVGPDGKDQDGAEIQTLITDDETGVKSVSDRLTPDSTGDITAPVL